MAATDGTLPKDINGFPAEGVYVPNVGTVALAGSNTTTDATGASSASSVVNLGQIAGTTTITPGDGVAFAGSVPSIQMQQSGTALASPRRVATKIVNLAAVAVTHGTEE